MLVSRITQLTKDDLIEDSQAAWLAIDRHRLMLPTRLAHLVRQLRDQDEPRWTLGRLGAVFTRLVNPGRCLLHVQCPGRGGSRLRINDLPWLRRTVPARAGQPGQASLGR